MQNIKQRCEIPENWADWEVKVVDNSKFETMQKVYLLVQLGYTFFIYYLL